MAKQLAKGGKAVGRAAGVGQAPMKSSAKAGTPKVKRPTTGKKSTTFPTRKPTKVTK